MISVLLGYLIGLIYGGLIVYVADKYSNHTIKPLVVATIAIPIVAGLFAWIFQNTFTFALLAGAGTVSAFMVIVYIVLSTFTD